jgi:hypothetical protein
MIRNLRKTSSHDRMRSRLSNRGGQFGNQQSAGNAAANLNDITAFRQAWQPKGANMRSGAGNDSFSIVPDAGKPVRDTGPPPEPPQMKLSPKLGRTVPVNPNGGMDVSSGMRRLDMLIAINRVRSDFNSQRFHERPGLKRKRLKSVRWRSRFKASFNHVCSRVMHLKKQGW